MLSLPNEVLIHVFSFIRGNYSELRLCSHRNKLICKRFNEIGERIKWHYLNAGKLKLEHCFQHQQPELYLNTVKINLKKLDLSFFKLLSNDQINSITSDQTALKKLILSPKNIDEKFVSCLRRLTSLKTLTITAIPEGGVPRELISSLKNHRVTVVLPKLKCLPCFDPTSLIFVSLNDLKNHMKGTVVRRVIATAEVGSCRIRQIDRFQDHELNELTAICQNVESVQVYGFTSRAVEGLLYQMPHLKNLRLNGCLNTSFNLFKNLVNLRCLVLERSLFPLTMECFIKLKVLSIRYCFFLESLSFLKELTTLEELEVEAGKYIQDIQEIQSLPYLKILGLSEIYKKELDLELLKKRKIKVYWIKE